MGLWKRLLRAAPAILFLILLTLAFSRLGVLHKLETLVPDALARFNGETSGGEVVIVNITDDDYQEIFQEMSPLNPSRLQELINNIAKGEPRVIGVDVDTSARTFKDAPLELEVPERTEVVWEREVFVPEDEREKLEPLDVWGGRDLALNESSGIPALLDDPEDKVTRRYSRLIQTAAGPMPSFAWAVVSRYPTEKTKALRPSMDELLINYSPPPKDPRCHEISASRVLARPAGRVWENECPIKDKIVLLGGSYLNQDRHDTPLGQKPGVVVLANVIETELQGGGFKPPEWYTTLLLEIFDGFVLILVFHHFPFRKALLVSLLLILVLAPGCSFISYHSIQRWIYFFPLLLGLLIFEVYEHSRRELVPHVYQEVVGETREGNSTSDVTHSKNPRKDSTKR